MTVPASRLEVVNLAITDGAGRMLVDRVSFSADRGITALVGESGSGKTMIAKAVLQLLPPGVTFSDGDVLLEGESLAQASDARLREIRGGNIGLVFQDPMVSLNPALTIGRQVTEALRRHHGATASEAREQALAMLSRVSIPQPEHCLESYPHQFSGGMRQRIMIASVMLLRPKLLIADEPTTALDTLVQGEVLDLIEELAHDFGSTVLLITHDLGLVRRYATDVVVLRAGQLVEAGPTQRLFEKPADPYTASLIAALPSEKTGPSPAADAPIVIAADSVSVSFGNEGLRRSGRRVDAVRDASLEIRAGETVGLVGGSGSGKSTLARVMLGAQPATRGKILFRGRDTAAMARPERKHYRISSQMVFQDPYSSLDPRISIRASVAEPLRLDRSLNRTERMDRAEAMLGEVGLQGMGDKLPHQLSGGQRQRVAIARAVIGEPELVIADEPVSALDMTVQQQVLELLASLQRRHGFACLFISHDFGAVAQVADRIVVMQDGRIIEEGSAHAMLHRPSHRYTEALIAASRHRVWPASAGAAK